MPLQLISATTQPAYVSTLLSVRRLYFFRDVFSISNLRRFPPFYVILYRFLRFYPHYHAVVARVLGVCPVSDHATAVCL